MITAILTMAVTWCLFYGRVPLPVLALLCVVLGATLAYMGRHSHASFLTIDMLAQESRLNRVNSDLKFWTAIVLMMLCVAARSWIPAVFLSVVLPVLIVCVGGLEFHEYIHLLSLPASFLLLGGLALLFEVAPIRTGVIGFPVFGVWLCVSVESQLRSALVIARAMGSVSCLYFLSLTTPMSELIGVMRRARCPDIIIELLYLIYRYIFILLFMHHTMRDAAKSRMGFADYQTSVRTTGNLYSNLLSRSYRYANKNFDAMESRCYDTGIRFLEKRVKVTGAQAAVAIGIAVFTLGLSLIN